MDGSTAIQVYCYCYCCCTTHNPMAGREDFACINVIMLRVACMYAALLQPARLPPGLVKDEGPSFLSVFSSSSSSSPCMQSELMSAGARLGMPSTEEAALLSSVIHAHR